MHGWTFDLFTIKPIVVILGTKDRGHTIVDRGGDGRGICGDDRKALESMAVRGLPSVPKPCEAEDRLIAHGEAERCFV